MRSQIFESELDKYCEGQDVVVELFERIVMEKLQPGAIDVRKSEFNRITPLRVALMEKENELELISDAYKTLAENGKVTNPERAIALLEGMNGQQRELIDEMRKMVTRPFGHKP